MNLKDKEPYFLAGVVVAGITLGFGVLSLQAWVLGVILGWFGFTLGFWKCFLIVLLVGSLLGSSRSSK